MVCFADVPALQRLMLCLQVLQAEYNRRLAIEKAQHDILTEPIRQRNTARHIAAEVRQEERQQVQLANDQLLQAAEQLHQQRLYEVSMHWA